MRVLHVLDHSLPQHSGYTFRTLAILREQQQLGWSTCQLTGPRQYSGDRMEEEIEGWHFFRTPVSGGHWAEAPVLGELAVMRALARRLHSVATAMRPDVIHVHSPVLIGLPASRVARRLGLPLVYEVRAFWEDAAVENGTERAGGLRYRATRALETSVLRRADSVTTICAGLRGEIISRGVAANRVTVIPNAVDSECFTEGRPADPELLRSLGLDGCSVLGFAGSFYRYEGLDILLRALASMRAGGERVKVLLVGGGPEETPLRDLAVQLGLDGAVVFTGRVPHERMPDYYALFDVLVYPRLRRRLTELVTPLKPLEAMAQGKAVAASDVGGHRELITHGKTGFLFQPESIEALAACVSDMLADRERLAGVRAAARRHVLRERTWQASVAQYTDVYGRISGILPGPRARSGVGL